MSPAARREANSSFTLVAVVAAVALPGLGMSATDCVLRRPVSAGKGRGTPS